ncbi:hypothetical protein ACTFIR_006457 [Dictyostelium discoideum]
MESYSPSIQKLCVFLKPESDISNTGISYLNNFLADMSNAVIVESIHSSKSHKHKTILIEDIESALNVVFPSEIADSIINQSKGRIQSTSLKNLMQVKTFNNNNNNNEQDNDLQEKEQNELSDDSDVEGFEIIPNNNNIYSHDVSLCFPIDLVCRVTLDYICRKKVIHQNPSDFYKVIEQQQSNHVVYTYISYALEVITTKILIKISPSTDLIDEDIIRKVIQDNHHLNSVRHKNIQASNIAGKLLDSSSSSNPNLQTSLSSSFIFSSSSNNTTTFTQQEQQEQFNDDKISGDEIEFEINNSKYLEKEDKKDQLIQKEEEIILKNFNDNNNNNNNNINNNINNVNNINNINNNDNNDNNDNNKNNDNKNNDKNNDNKNYNNNNADKIEKLSTVNNNVKNSEIEKNIEKLKNINNNNNNVGINEALISIIKETCKNIPSSSSSFSSVKNLKRSPPSLFKFKEPIDLVQVLAEGGIHMEATNGMFLVLLVLMGFVIQHVTHTQQVC